MELNQMNGRAVLDEMDLKILKLLQNDAKKAYGDIGKEVHLTAPAVHARVKKMEKAGVIKSYSINIDFEKVGLPVTAFVRLQTGKIKCSEAGNLVDKFPEIVECHAVAGEDDLILKTRTSTPLELQNLLDRMRMEGISEKSNSIFVLQSYFERSRL